MHTDVIDNTQTIDNIMLYLKIVPMEKYLFSQIMTFYEEYLGQFQHHVLMHNLA